jgi:hypothetical protein
MSLFRETKIPYPFFPVSLFSNRARVRYLFFHELLFNAVSLLERYRKTRTNVVVSLWFQEKKTHFIYLVLNQLKCDARNFYFWINYKK